MGKKTSIAHEIVFLWREMLNTKCVSLRSTHAQRINYAAKFNYSLSNLYKQCKSLKYWNGMLTEVLFKFSKQIWSWEVFLTHLSFSSAGLSFQFIQFSLKLMNWEYCTSRAVAKWVQNFTVCFLRNGLIDPLWEPHLSQFSKWSLDLVSNK